MGYKCFLFPLKISVNYCIVCASVRDSEDSVQMQITTITCSLYWHAFALCALRYILRRKSLVSTDTVCNDFVGKS